MTPLHTISRPLAVGQITALHTYASMLSAASSRADFENFVMKNRNENVFDTSKIVLILWFYFSEVHEHIYIPFFLALLDLDAGKWPLSLRLSYVVCYGVQRSSRLGLAAYKATTSYKYTYTHAAVTGVYACAVCVWVALFVRSPTCFNSFDLKERMIFFLINRWYFLGIWEPKPDNYSWMCSVKSWLPDRATKTTTFCKFGGPTSIFSGPGPPGHR